MNDIYVITLARWHGQGNQGKFGENRNNLILQNKAKSLIFNGWPPEHV